MAATEFRRGFKSEAERIALELRAELGLGARGRLDPGVLAEHLCIPVMSLRELERAAPDHVRHFLGEGSTIFSAVTIHVSRSRRVIITNPAHAATRQMSNLCHELGHVILDHEGEAPLKISGGREWNGMQEREADWLAASLLIPNEAAYAAACDGLSDAAVAAEFGVSSALAAWRMNMSGARKRAQRAAKYARRSRW